MTTRPQIIGHRGASASAPENTIEAYRLALTQRADGFEFDVRVTATGDLVLHHDAHLPDGRSVVETATTDLPASVPSLVAALDIARDGAVVANIELKNIPGEAGFDPDCGVADAVCALLAARGGTDAVLISSFHLGTIDRCKVLDPAVPTALLTFVAPMPMDAIAVTVERGHGAINPFLPTIDAALVDAAHAAGLAVNAWTVNGPDDLLRMADLGVDAIITDDPALAIALLD